MTDAERVQNCTKIWPALRKVVAYCTIKVDGRSTTMVYAHNLERMEARAESAIDALLAC